MPTPEFEQLAEPCALPGVDFPDSMNIDEEELEVGRSISIPAANAVFTGSGASSTGISSESESLSLA